jgi:hypothetical protein
VAALKVTWIGAWTLDQSRQLTEDLLQFFYDQHQRPDRPDAETSAVRPRPMARAESGPS